MKAILFTYTTEGLNKTEASKISKEITGYKDNSNKGNYEYKREGLIQNCNGIIISKSTFIIPSNYEKELNRLKKKGLKVKKWEINVPKSYFTG